MGATPLRSRNVAPRWELVKRHAMPLQGQGAKQVDIQETFGLVVAEIDINLEDHWILGQSEPTDLG
jgi:hypothetical protein